MPNTIRYSPMLRILVVRESREETGLKVPEVGNMQTVGHHAKYEGLTCKSKRALNPEQELEGQVRFPGRVVC